MTMSRIITQTNLFDYMENTELGDLERFSILLEYLPLEDLASKMDDDRHNGRNDYPNLTLLKIKAAQKCFQLPRISDIRRELLRNPVLRKLCGLNDESANLLKMTYKGNARSIVPNPNVFTRFKKRMIKHQDDFEKMFNDLRDTFFDIDSNFGKIVAGDGKYFDSYAKREHSNPSGDDRGENDAQWSTKSYRYIGQNGKLCIKKEHHFGFKKHTLVDTVTEMPIASIVTAANADEKKIMIELLESLPAHILSRINYGTFDRGYDSKKFRDTVLGKGITPIIDIRMMRKGDKLQQYRETNIYYTEAGEVFYYDEVITDETIDEKTGHPRYFQKMKYEGYDKDRNALRYSYKGKIHRIYIKDDDKVFNKVARDSEKFHRLYNCRTSVERYHGRLDRDLCFEKHTIRGLAKMKIEVTFADCVMMAFGITHIMKNQTNIASIYSF